MFQDFKTAVKYNKTGRNSLNRHTVVCDLFSRVSKTSFFSMHQREQHLQLIN